MWVGHLRGLKSSVLRGVLRADAAADEVADKDMGEADGADNDDGYLLTAPMPRNLLQNYTCNLPCRPNKGPMLKEYFLSLSKWVRCAYD